MPGPPRTVGRYAIHGQIAAGGIAAVHLGRQLGAAGFARTVAIKRLHPQFAGEPEFVSMFLDEARIAARLRHPNVVPTLDIVASDGELFLVMEYVHGATLARLMRNTKLAGEHVPPPVAGAVMSGVMRGLHAAHEARDERGRPLDIVHRDVSPQNVMVDADGVARVLDFGIAKAVGRLHTTRKGELKGKFGYMAPEQLTGGEVTRSSDVYAASVVLWELLAGRRLFHDANEAGIMRLVLTARIDPPSAVVPGIPPELDAIVMRGLSREPADRFATAAEMADAIESAVAVAIVPMVAAWVERIAAQELAAQAALVAEVERASASAARAAPAAVAPALAADALRTGHVLAGKYRIDHVLGSGAMGKVLAATHLQLDTKVALKVMLPETTATTPEAAGRFLREARAAAKLKSEHVAKVHDVGSLEDGTPYMVMELLEGRDLGALIAERRGPFLVEEAAEYVLQACEAVAEAHALGIVHRDLKPANLFVTRRPEGLPCVKVLDFGISKANALEEATSLATSATALLGSPHYMSPEQLKSARDVDARADVWSLGVILYQLASGQVPFRAESLGQLMAKVLTEEPPPLEGIRSDLPPEFVQLVASCLRKDVERRCPSVATVAAALSRFAPERSRHLADRVATLLGGDTTADAVTTVRVDPLTEPASPEFGTVGGTVMTRLVRRRPRVTLAVAGGGVLLLTAIGVGALLVSRSHGADSPAQPATTVAATSLPSAEGDAATIEPPPTAAAATTDSMPTASATPPASHGRRPRGAGKGGNAPPPPAATSAGPRYNPLDHL
ncbi:MAG TPA: serine/threonine-protein kinase [Polyangiaceae bacterium]|nr:serine/threonine-protein kinase [Polyangiaceae bacterium]